MLAELPIFLKRNIITFFLYFLLTFLVIVLSAALNSSFIILPTLAIGIITSLTWGHRIFPALYIAQFCLNLILYPELNNIFSLDQFLVNNVFVIINLAIYYLGALIIKRFFESPVFLITNKSILKFFFLIAPLVSIFSSSALFLAKIQLGLIVNTTFYNSFFSSFYSSFIGFIIFAPIILVIISQPRSIWKPRYSTVLAPIVATFLLINLVFFKTEDDNSTHQDIKTFNVKVKLIANKISQKTAWLSTFSKNLNNNIPTTNKIKSIDNYLGSLSAKDSLIKTTIRLDDLNNHYFHSPINNNNNLIAIKAYDFMKLIKDVKFSKQSNSGIVFISEINEFANIYRLKINNTTHTVILIYDILQLFRQEISNYFTNVNVKLTTSKQNSITLINHLKPLQSSENTKTSKIRIQDKTWNISFTPTSEYFDNSRYFILQIGFLLTGFIGFLVLLITGKTTRIDKKLIQNTLKLKSNVNKFIEHKKQYLNLIKHHPVVLWRLDTDSNKFSYVSDKIESLFGYPKKNWLEIENFWINNIHDEDQKQVKEIISRVISSKKSIEFEYRFIKANSDIVWLKDVVSFDRNNKSHSQLTGLMLDTTESKEAIKGKYLSDDKYRVLFKHAIDPLVIINLDDNLFKDSNDKAISFFGLNNISGHVGLASFSTLKQPDGSNSKKKLYAIYKRLNEIGYYNFEWCLLDKGHKVRTCNIDLVKLPGKRQNLALVNIHDITEKRRREKKITQLAYYDKLTKLPNREYFYTKLKQIHSLAYKQRKYGTILFLDLDRFKLLNDSLGHRVGDILLKLVAKRIQFICKDRDFSARLSGDEFVIVSKNLMANHQSVIDSTLRKSKLLLSLLNKPYQLGNYEHQITVSIGITTFPQINCSIDDILHRADIAMYSSKEKGANKITFYKKDMIIPVKEKLRVEKAVKNAFKNNEFKLNYQTQHNASGVITSVEALVRWDKLRKYRISTTELIECMERIGLIHDFSRWSFNQAFANLAEWKNKGYAINPIAVNVSVKQFRNKKFISNIISIVKAYSLLPSQITIEITEGILILDIDYIITKLQRLKNFGFNISLDNFGTEYSSLAFLKQLPITQLKIGKLFIKDIAIDKSTRQVTKSVIDLANNLNIKVVSIDIENIEQFLTLRKLGCKIFQGHYFSQAVSSEEIQLVLDKEKYLLLEKRNLGQVFTQHNFS